MVCRSVGLRFPLLLLLSAVGGPVRDKVVGIPFEVASVAEDQKLGHSTTEPIRLTFLLKSFYMPSLLAGRLSRRLYLKVIPQFLFRLPKFHSNY